MTTRNRYLLAAAALLFVLALTPPGAAAIGAFRDTAEQQRAYSASVVAEREVEVARIAACAEAE